ncbi:thioredoxin family protein [bacterium]|nr:thioredoxin family protein [bacterium]
MARAVVPLVAAIALAATVSAGAATAPAGVVKLGGAIEALPGGRARARATLEIAPGFHVNAHVPRQAFLVPTDLTLTSGGFGPPSYPEPVERKFAFAGDEALLVYDGTVRIVAESDRMPEGPVVARLRYQACDDDRCLPPRTVEAVLAPAKGSAAAGAVAVEGAAANAPRPADGTAASASAAATVPAGASAGNPGAGRDSRPWLARWLAKASLPAAIAMTFVLGLGLNLTPCVYPLVSVTIAYFGQQAPGGRGSLPLAAAYVAGITLTFALLGTVAALAGGLVGAPLQHPAVLLGLSMLLVGLSASSFGLFEIRAPSALVERFGRSTAGVAGAFLMGLTMGVVAAPCIGPVVLGLLVYVGSRRDALLGLLLFLSMGLGMGLPYLLLASAAGSISSLPRSGEWLRWTNRLFGFVLLGMAAYFASPLLPEGLSRLALPAIGAIAGLYLGFLEPSGRALRGFTAARRGLGAIAIAGATWSALGTSGVASRPDSPIRWEPLGVDSLERAIASRRPAILEFGADWCLPCGLMERTTFVDADVARESGRFTMLAADVTESSPENEALLARFGVLGVPTVIFFGADGVEVDRTVGYVDAVRFADLMRKVADGRPVGAAAPSGAGGDGGSDADEASRSPRG